MILVATMAHCGLMDFIKYYKNPVIRSIYRHRRERKNEYVETIDSIIENEKYFNKKYLVECLSKKTPAYIKRRKDFVITNYGGVTHSNNKGIDEFIKLKKLIQRNAISPEEKIIKITGRYRICSAIFLENAFECFEDVIVRRDNDLWGERGKGVHTYCFMAKAKVLVAFGEHLRRKEISEKVGKSPVEWEFYNFIMSSDYEKTLYKGSLGVFTPFAKI